MGKDLGTYHVRVELVSGDGFFMGWNTNGRFIPNHAWRDDCSTLDSWFQPPLYDSEEDLKHSVLFMFLDGNYSCDCNKRLFLARAKGEDDPDDNPCGDTMEIKTITLMHPDGTPERLWAKDLSDELHS